jgi:hypothetical protein
MSFGCEVVNVTEQEVVVLGQPAMAEPSTVGVSSNGTLPTLLTFWYGMFSEVELGV